MNDTATPDNLEGTKKNLKTFSNWLLFIVVCIILLPAVNTITSLLNFFITFNDKEQLEIHGMLYFLIMLLIAAIGFIFAYFMLGLASLLISGKKTYKKTIIIALLFYLITFSFFAVLIVQNANIIGSISSEAYHNKTTRYDANKTLFYPPQSIIMFDLIFFFSVAAKAAMVDRILYFTIAAFNLALLVIVPFRIVQISKVNGNEQLKFIRDSLKISFGKKKDKIRVDA